MALCTPMTMNLNENSFSSYPHQMYKPKFKQVRGINCRQLTERLARSFSVEGIRPISTNTKTYNRTNSLFQYEQTTNEFYLTTTTTTIPNDFEFFSISEEDNDKRYYSTKKPYPYPMIEHCLSSPPIGYKPIGIQLLARHGSRSLNGHDYDIQTLQIWQLAKEKNMLTTLGEQLKEDTELFMNANNHVGRGELTQVGRKEHFDLATRLYHRLKTLFNSFNKISVVTSGKKRAIDSADEFINGLKKFETNLQILKENSNKNLLYFHKLCSNYMTFKKTDLNIKTKLESIKNCEQTKNYSQQVLKRIYHTEFIDLLIHGNYQIECDDDKPKNEVDIVLCLYSMFAVAPAQNQPHLKRMLAKYFNEEESNWFAYINDAQEFYVKGPSIEGTTVTYDMAKPLLADFFSSINTCIEDRTNITGHLRFAHAETIIPFATLLQIPGYSDQAVHSLDLYTYENNQWRGDQIAPMAANIQWEIYQSEINSKQILIRMLYNEIEVRFKEDCQPITPNSYFYDLDELKRAYANVLLPSNTNEN